MVNKSRRKFLEIIVAGGISVAGIGLGIKGLNFLTDEKKIKEKIEELDINAYRKLLDSVKDYKEEFPLKGTGWREYASQDFKEYHCLDDITSVNKVTDFYRILNGGQSGPVMGKKIKRPVWNCNTINFKQ